MKPFLIALGSLAALLIVSQLVMGLLILRGAEVKIRTMHQHSGYLTVAVVLTYIALSLVRIASTPRPAPGLTIPGRAGGRRSPRR